MNMYLGGHFENAASSEEVGQMLVQARSLEHGIERGDHVLAERGVRQTLGQLLKQTLRKTSYDWTGCGCHHMIG